MILIEDKVALMEKMGEKRLSIILEKPLDVLPKKLAALGLTLSADKSQLTYAYDSKHMRPDIAGVLRGLETAKIQYRDLATAQSSLEDIFMGLVKQ